MNQEPGSKKIIKYTLEAVFSAQERLRKHLEQLIEENRCLKDDKERDLFFRELTYSTLGLGKERIVKFNIHTEKYLYTGVNKDVETVARWLGSQKTNMVTVPLHLFEPYQEQYKGQAPISELWQCLLNNLFIVWPRAVDRATSISKEQSDKGKSSGYQVK